MKPCTDCKAKKPLNLFPIQKRNIDGRTNRCKKCLYIKYKERILRRQSKYRKNPEVKKRISEYLKRYREKNKKTARNYAHSYHIENAEVLREKARIRAVKYRKTDKYKIRRKVWNKVYWAVKTGKIEKKPCECGNEKSLAHHEDYAKPLVVEWLCRGCHGNLHIKKLADLKSYQ